MANCLLLHPNRSDPPRGAAAGAALSGGGWVRPLTNMQTRGLSRVAQSADTDLASTQFDVTMTAQNELFAVVLVGHNLTVTASVRITAWYDENSYEDPDYQSQQDVYPSLYFTEDLAWEAENWWDGKPLSEELEGYSQNAIHILPQAIFAPNWRIEIFDESNPVGYVRIARLWMAGGWRPPQNYVYGGSLRIETATAVVEALSGAEYFDRRAPFRVAQIAFEYMDQQEALSRGLELCRRAGIDGELFYITDPADARNLTRTSFLGRLRQLAAWEQVVFERANIAFEIKELL